MPQSLARLLVHLVFSTKNRVPFLQSSPLRSEVHAYLTASLRGQDCEPVQVGGVADHVHLLFGLSRTISLAELVKQLKTSSTKMMREKGHPSFSWQTGYGAFSVSESNKSAVIAYIVDQEIHHRKMTFQDEIRVLLKRHSMRFDERYIWD
ncbi:MAG TPA: IS200/IS605 family transposase [Chthoniobacterales bacterium]|nr:IS200/IS605 family transposase [Chthoniobacterales bacterium]